MKFLFFAFIVAVCVTLGSSAELRKKDMRIINQLSKLHPKKINYQNVVGTFPTNPTYAVMQLYENPGCKGYAGGVSYLLNTCLASASSSVKYVCTDGDLTQYDYSDTACATLTDTSSFPPTGQCINTDDDGISAKVTKCGTSDPNDYGPATIIQSYNQDISCTQVVGTVGLPNGMCQTISATESVKFKWPKGYVYGTADCSGSVEGSAAFPTTCDIPDPTDVDDTVQYDSYSTYTFVSSAISTRFIGLGAILSVVLAALQLIKN